MPIRLTVNGKPVVTDVAPSLTLLRFLREHLDLTGAKNGCSEGHCGACTVIVNGKARRACLLRVADVAGGAVETVEGLAQDGRLHPLQEAFIAHGAIQCGFCTPGMLMTAKALLDSNSQPSEQDIRAALARNHNLCRCTGYVRIVRAIQDAARRLSAGLSLPPAAELGHATALRRQAIEKVMGATRFANDIKLPGMLHGKIFWAAYPHAEILHLDIREASAMPGVVAVISARDIPGRNVAGLIVPDQPAIADKLTRHIGDAVACVFAETPELAEAACAKIRVDYRPLPGVFSPQEAAQPGAPLVHAAGNLIRDTRLERGDVLAAFSRCAAIVEHDYHTPYVEHAYLEPEAGLAEPAADGGITLYIGTQGAFDDRRQLADILDLPAEKIRVIQLPMGGAFGAKEELLLHQFLALGALRTGRPVKLVLTRRESLRAHPKRHPSWIHLKLGADADGRLLALQGEVTLDGGAYTSLSINVLETALINLSPYFVPNLLLEGRVWYTNNITAGAMRGFGVNQAAFAMESSMDDLAHALHLDPFEIRLRNALQPGLPTAADCLLEPGSLSLVETLQALQEALDRTPLPASEVNRRIGVGVACAVKTVGFGRGRPESAGVRLELSSTGRCRVLASLHDMGQGASEALAQMTSQELGIPLEQIEIVPPDTAVSPEMGTTTASRGTFITGNALLLAAAELRDCLARRAAAELQADPSDIFLAGAELINRADGRRLPLRQLGERFVTEKRYRAPDTVGLEPGWRSEWGTPRFQSCRHHYSFSCNAQAAIVEVNTDTGAVKVLKVIAAQDVGRIVNRQAIEGQIEGGVVMGTGFALSEEFVIEQGINITQSLRACRLPTALEAPEVITILLETPDPLGPRGARGLGELPTIPTAPAILNAIRDAVGIRVTKLPATPDKVLAALRTHRSYMDEEVIARQR